MADLTATENTNMFLKPLIAGALLASSATFAFAQATPPPAPGGQPPAAAEPAPPPPPPGGPGGPGMRRGMGPDMRKIGFDIRMGKDSGLKVDCGETALADCIAAAQPLIDQMTAMMPPPPPGAGTPPPPKG